MANTISHRNNPSVTSIEAKGIYPMDSQPVHSVNLTSPPSQKKPCTVQTSTIALTLDYTAEKSPGAALLVTAETVEKSTYYPP